MDPTPGILGPQRIPTSSVSVATPTCPFGYPNVGSANEAGHQLMTYPVDITRYLQHPLVVGQQTAEDKQKRKKMKKRMTAQLESY
jgi:hypothetical protein